MDGEIWFLILIGIAIALAFWAVVAGAFADVAEKKGHDRRTYWHWVFWFGPVGIPLVIALPDVKAQQYQQRMVDRLDDVIKHLEKLNQQTASQAANNGAANTTVIELPEL